MFTKFIEHSPNFLIRTYGSPQRQVCFIVYTNDAQMAAVLRQPILRPAICVVLLINPSLANTWMTPAYQSGLLLYQRHCVNMVITSFVQSLFVHIFFCPITYFVHYSMKSNLFLHPVIKYQFFFVQFAYIWKIAHPIMYYLLFLI